MSRCCGNSRSQFVQDQDDCVNANGFGIIWSDGKSQRGPAGWGSTVNTWGLGGDTCSSYVDHGVLVNLRKYAGVITLHAFCGCVEKVGSTKRY